jgi:ABC-2 type transport system ATP-binding protein
MEKALVLTNSIKKYKGFQLGPISFELESGIVCGYIGPNGAGKTTTMHCISGLIKTNGGTIEIFGRKNDINHPEWKHNIGYVGDYNPFYENWTGTKNLKIISRFFPSWSDHTVQELAYRFNAQLDKPVKSLSTGNRLKLALISVLARSPRLLLFDEPTAGLDPVVRAEVLDVLFEILEKGDSSIFYSTHILSDISRLADDLVFLKNGKIILRKTKDDLTDNWRKITFRLDKQYSTFEAVVKVRQEEREYQLISSNYQATIRQLRSIGAENIQENRLTIDEIAVEILKGGSDVISSL